MKVYREVLCPDCGKKYMTYFMIMDMMLQYIREVPSAGQQI